MNTVETDKRLPFVTTSILPKEGSKIVFQRKGTPLNCGIFLNNKFNFNGGSYPAKDVHFWQYGHKFGK